MAGNADQVIVGSAELFVAPLGATAPDITQWPVSFSGDWESVGFTKDGVEVQTTVSVKNIEVDELPNPVQRIIDKEDAKVTAKLSQATLDNINRALSTATLDGSTTAPTGSTVGYRTLTFGGGSLKYFQLCIVGPAEDGFLGRILQAYKVLPTGNVTFSSKRTEETVIGVEFGLVADTDRSAGDQVWSMTDITEDHTT